jgi:hypothetical protein
MATNVTYNGTSYAIPAAGELNWTSLSAFLIDVGQTAALNTIDKQSIRVATTTPVTISATTDFAVVTNLSVAGAVGVTLPAGVNGQMFIILDGKGDALTNNITITPNGAETINGAATLVLAQNRQSVILQYSSTGTQWRVLGSYFTTLANALVNPMTTTGDVIVATSGGTPARLGVGATGTVLKGGTTPSYASVVNADVDAAAAIAGTKISPNFGSQAVLTTGSVTGTKVYSYGAPLQTNGSASTFYSRATSSTSNMLTLGNSGGGDGFSILYDPNAGITYMATNGATPTTSPALTLSGTGLLGWTSGATPGSGTIGEYFTAVHSGGTVTTATANTMVGIHTWGLSAGIWQLSGCYSVSLYTTATSPLNMGLVGGIRLYNVTDTTVLSQAVGSFQQSMSSTAMSVTHTLTFNTIVNITATKTVGVYIICNQNNVAAGGKVETYSNGSSISGSVFSAAYTTGVRIR